MRGNKIRLGYTNEYVDADDLDKQKADELIKERNLKCSFCSSELKEGNWVAILHTPGSPDKSKRMHFFCLSNNCHHKWSMQSQEKREG